MTKKLTTPCKIWKTGNSNVITIPLSFLESGLLKHNVIYLVTIEEVEKEVEKNAIKSDGNTK